MGQALLKSCREQSGMSQKDLAYLLEVSQATICFYETGQRKLPVKTAMRLGALFNLPWASFYEDSGVEK